MIGQQKLLTQLHNYSIDTFPRSVMLLGENGIGKHTLAKYISTDILHLPLVDISENISHEYISQIYLNPNPLIYLIDLNKMTEKESNVLLKLIEEPIATSFLILIADSKNAVLNTVLNRCIIFELNQYSREELKEFTKGCANEELILNIVRTPGKIINLNLDNFNDLYSLGTTIVQRLKSASYLNTLSIANKINYKDEYNKFDFDLFFDVLLYCAANDFLTNKNPSSYKIYLSTSEYYKKMLDKRLNKELFMTNFLSNLWKVART